MKRLTFEKDKCVFVGHTDHDKQFKRPILAVDIQTGKITVDRLDKIDDRFGVMEDDKDKRSRGQEDGVNQQGTAEIPQQKGRG